MFEACVYAADLDAAIAFYGGVLGLAVESDFRPTGVVFRAGPGSVVIVFDPAESSRAGRDVPAHGADGPGHVALSADPGERGAWRDLLTEEGVEIEREIAWPSGAWSVYVRDPGGNSVELAGRDLWS